MSKSAVDLWDDLSKATDEVRLLKQNKIKLKTAQKLF